jgi:hypothetical protein
MGRDNKGGRGGKPGRGGGDGGRGRKDKRGGRGGGDKSYNNDKMYIENIDQLMLRKEKGDISDEEEEEEEEEESGEEGEESQQNTEKAEKPAETDAAVDATVFAFQKKAAIKPKAAVEEEEEADEGLANDPNFAKKEVDPNDPEAGMNRKER